MMIITYMMQAHGHSQRQTACHAPSKVHNMAPQPDKQATHTRPLRKVAVAAMHV